MIKQSTILYFLLIFVPILISLGQIFFKLASRLLTSDFSLYNVMFNRFTILSLLIYATATAMWIYILSKMDLARAYPFSGLTFALVPLFSHLFFNENIGKLYFLGIIFISLGVILCQL